MAKKYQPVKIKSTSRSFTQDAELAMKGDILRGIVELVTNSDDAYGSERDGGEINIHLDFDNPEGLIVKVHDLAKGLLWDDLEKNMMQLGRKPVDMLKEMKSEAFLEEGQKMLRSLEKLLLKRFEGKFSALEIDGTSWDALPLEKTQLQQLKPVALNIPEGKSGFCATITCSKSKYQHFLNKRQSNLLQKSVTMYNFGKLANGVIFLCSSWIECDAGA